MNRRALVIVSLAAITVLGGIAVALALVTDDPGDSDGEGRTAITGPGSDGVPFRDPQGDYRLDVDPAWRAESEPVDARVESWAVGANGTDGAGGAATDRVAVEATEVGEVDLDQYLQLVIERAPDEIDDFKLREFRVVSIDVADPSAPPRQLGVVAYEGTRDSAPVAYLLVATVEAGRAVVATLATTQRRFAEARAEVEPYLMTLQQT